MDFEIRVGGPIIDEDDIQSVVNALREGSLSGGIYAEKFVNPFSAAKRGYVDDIIPPSRTRFRVIKALTMLEHKQDSNPAKKHGNIPL